MRVGAQDFPDVALHARPAKSQSATSVAVCSKTNWFEYVDSLSTE